jgi:hypothetical protein
MKNLFIILVYVGTLVSIAHAQQWVSFSSSNPVSPELMLKTSNVQNVIFEVTIPGIYQSDTVVNGVTFSHLAQNGRI